MPKELLKGLDRLVKVNTVTALCSRTMSHGPLLQRLKFSAHYCCLVVDIRALSTCTNEQTPKRNLERQVKDDMHAVWQAGRRSRGRVADSQAGVRAGGRGGIQAGRQAGGRMGFQAGRQPEASRLIEA